MRLKSELYKNEQEELINRLINIINLAKKKNFIWKRGYEGCRYAKII